MATPPLWTLACVVIGGVLAWGGVWYTARQQRNAALTQRLREAYVDLLASIPAELRARYVQATGSTPRESTRDLEAHIRDTTVAVTRATFAVILLEREDAFRLKVDALFASVLDAYQLRAAEAFGARAMEIHAKLEELAADVRDTHPLLRV